MSLLWGAFTEPRYRVLPPSWIPETSKNLSLLIEALSDVVGLSKVRTSIVRHFGTSDHDHTVFGVLCSLFKEKCPFYDGNPFMHPQASLALLDWTCEGAKELQLEIQAMLKKLEDRERAQQ